MMTLVRDREPSEASQLEDMKLAQVSQLAGLLTLGHQWTSKIERDLWAASLLYIEQRGNAKLLGEVNINHPEGEA